MRKKFVVFGTGTKADELWYHRIPVQYFVDNDQRKWGTMHRGIPVRAPQDLLNENKEHLIVIIASIYHAEIASQLESYGLREGVHFYRNDGQVYSEMMPEEFNEITTFGNLHKGARAFIIGNGPSLRISDLERLKEEITFASNNIFVAFQETSWRPTYYTMIDREAARNNRDNVASLLSTKVMPHYLYTFIGPNPKCCWVPSVEFNGEEAEIGFSEDVRKHINCGITVTYFNLQLAAYMGISDIYLLGVDFDYGSVPKLDHDHPEKYYAHKPEYNIYFHPDYHKVGEICNRPNMDAQYRCFQAAFRVLNQKGVRVWNASRSTKLDVFPRVDFDTLFD